MPGGVAQNSAYDTETVTVNCNARREGDLRRDRLERRRRGPRALDAAHHADHHEQRRDRLPGHGRQRQRQHEHVHALRPLLHGLRSGREPTSGPRWPRRRTLGTKPAQSRDILRPYGREVLGRAITFALVGLEPRRVEVEAHLRTGAAAVVLDRRAGRPRLPGGEAPRPERRPLVAARVARPGDHGQSRARRAAQGGDGIRPRDRAHGARRIGAGPCRPARRARVHRRARARRPGPARRRDDRGGRGRGAGRARAPALLGGLVARGGARRASRRSACVTSRRRSATSAARTRSPPRAPEDDPRPPPDASRPRRRPRAGAGPAGARARGRGCAQPPPRRSARDGQDDARAPAPVDPAAAHPRGGARGDADPLRRRHARAGLRPARRPPPFRAPHHGASAAAIIGGGRCRGPGRSASPIEACFFSTSCRSSRARCSRRCASHSRTASSRSRASAGAGCSPRDSASSRR